MLISSLQQSESAVHIHIFYLFWISSPFRSSQSTEKSFLCRKVSGNSSNKMSWFSLATYWEPCNHAILLLLLSYCFFLRASAYGFSCIFYLLFYFNVDCFSVILYDSCSVSSTRKFKENSWGSDFSNQTSSQPTGSFYAHSMDGCWFLIQSVFARGFKDAKHNSDLEHEEQL